MFCRGLVIEGASSTGKSTLLNELLRCDAYLDRGYSSSLVLSEHHTQRVLEPVQAKRALRVEDNVELLEDLLTWIERRAKRACEHDWEARERTNHRLAFVLERFHFTHVFHYDHVTWDHVVHIDQRLHELNTVLVVLTSSRAHMRERLNKRGPQWHQYMSSLGQTTENILDHYELQQQMLLEFVAKSSLPNLIFDTSNADPVRTAATICRMWLFDGP